MKLIRWYQSATNAKRARVAAGVVAFFSFIISYSHLHEVAYRIGENRLAAVLLPLVIDIAVIAGIYMGLSAAEKGQRRGFWAWLVLWAGGATTVAGNLVSSGEGLTAKLGAVVAPIFMIITVEVLSDLVSRVEQPEAEPVKVMTAREMVRANPDITPEEIVNAKGCGLRYAERIIREEGSKGLRTSSNLSRTVSELFGTLFYQGL